MFWTFLERLVFYKIVVVTYLKPLLWNATFPYFYCTAIELNFVEEDKAVDKRVITSMPKIALIPSEAYGKTIGLKSRLNTAFIRILSKNNHVFWSLWNKMVDDKTWKVHFSKTYAEGGRFLKRSYPSIS